MKRPQWTRDPAAPSLALFAGFVATGFAAIVLGWRVAARTVFVGQQVPALVSGALGGVVMVALGAGLFSIQTSRRLGAAERLAEELLLGEAHSLLNAARERA